MPFNVRYWRSTLRSRVSRSAARRPERERVRRDRHRFSRTALVSPMGQVRFNMEPVCCHGNASVTAGQSKYAPVPIVKNGASQSATQRSQRKSERDSAESSASSFSRSVPVRRTFQVRAGLLGSGLPPRTPMAIATGIWIAKTFSVLRAPRLSPSRSMIQRSSKTSLILRRMPGNAFPRRYEDAVMKVTMPGPAVESNTFQRAQRQK